MIHLKLLFYILKHIIEMNVKRQLIYMLDNLKRYECSSSDKGSSFAVSVSFTEEESSSDEVDKDESDEQ